MKRAIVSVITGGYDDLPPAPNFEGWDVIMFTDAEVDPKGWDVRKLPKVDNPLVQSRDIKIRPHLHLPEYELYCYIDGNQKFIKRPPTEPIWFKHQRRTNIFQEAIQIINNGRFPAEIMTKQINYYKRKGIESF